MPMVTGHCEASVGQQCGRMLPRSNIMGQNSHLQWCVSADSAFSQHSNWNAFDVNVCQCCRRANSEQATPCKQHPEPDALSSRSDLSMATIESPGNLTHRDGACHVINPSMLVQGNREAGCPPEAILWARCQAAGQAIPSNPTTGGQAQASCRLHRPPAKLLWCSHCTGPLPWMNPKLRNQKRLPPRRGLVAMG